MRSRDAVECERKEIAKAMSAGKRNKRSTAANAESSHHKRRRHALKVHCLSIFESLR